MTVAIALVAGLVFAFGLTLGGVTDPYVLLAFLDVTGDAWDPRPLIVMASASAVFGAAYWLGRRRGLPKGAEAPRGRITARLLYGSVLFGIGWGTVGVCPGPALAAAAAGTDAALLFLAALLVGLAANTFISRGNLAAAGCTATDGCSTADG